MATKGSVLTERRTSASDYIKFLHAWIRKPRQTASIVPSSPYLGRMMASQIDPQGGPVIEFGGGTGALTRQILATGLPSDQLEVVEINETLARNLRRSLHGVRVIEAPAQSVLAEAAGGAGGYQCVISGLPLLAMSKSLQHAIVAEAFRCSGPAALSSSSLIRRARPSRRAWPMRSISAWNASGRSCGMCRRPPSSAIAARQTSRRTEPVRPRGQMPRAT